MNNEQTTNCSPDKIPPQNESLQEMSFLDHFKELRRRLILIIAGLFVGMLVCLSFTDQLYLWLATPIYNALPIDSKSLIFLNPVEPFFVYLKLALYASIFLTAPFTFYQIWKFIAPGLYLHEKRKFLPLSITCAAIFIAGAAFCYYLVLPLGLTTLMEFSTTTAVSLEAQITMSAYFDLLVKFLIAFGLTFEMPIFFFLLGRLGLISHKSLLKHWRGAVVTIFIAAAILTPPDVVTQTCLAIPMILLYAISVILVYWTEKRANSDSIEDTSPQNKQLQQ